MPTENLQEFTKRQDCETFRVHNALIFENGAIVHADGGEMVEPPTEHLANLRARRKWCQTVLDWEEREFTRFQDDALMKISAGERRLAVCGPPFDAAEQLTRGKQRIEKLRAQIAKIDKQLSDLPDAKSNVRGQATAADARDRQRELAHEIGSIQI